VDEPQEMPFLFQSPEGDSLFFYPTPGLIVTALFAAIGFQSPEGDSLFFYSSADCC
jgi:hypothetical protein